MATPEKMPDMTPICFSCGEPMEWTSEFREIELEGGFIGTIYEPIYECSNPDCIENDDSD